MLAWNDANPTTNFKDIQYITNQTVQSSELTSNQDSWSQTMTEKMVKIPRMQELQKTIWQKSKPGKTITLTVSDATQKLFKLYSV